MQEKFSPTIIVGHNNNVYSHLNEGIENMNYDFRSAVNFGSLHVPRTTNLIINSPRVIRLISNRIKLRSILAPIHGITTTKCLKLADVCDSHRIDNAKIMDYLSYPIIAKLQDADKRKHEMLSNVDDLIEFIHNLSSSSISSYILEEYFKHDEDIRVYASPLLESQFIKYMFNRTIKQQDRYISKLSDEGSRSDGIILAMRREGMSKVKVIDPVAYNDPTIFSKIHEPRPDICSIAMKVLRAVQLDAGYVDLLWNNTSETCRISKVGCNPGKSLDINGMNIVAEHLKLVLPHLIVRKRLETSKYLTIPKHHVRDSD